MKSTGVGSGYLGDQGNSGAVAAEDPVLAFISSSFRSVWTLELLRFLAERPDKPVSIEELIEQLRISHSVATHGLASLEAGGLILADDEQRVRYHPPDEATADLVAAAVQLYLTSPNKVRRAIVSSTSPGLSAFSDAFRLRPKS
jgi:DNA-binding transcriptional ArsR family regulator